jgi:hypothetical protein
LRERQLTILAFLSLLPIVITASFSRILLVRAEQDQTIAGGATSSLPETVLIVGFVFAVPLGVVLLMCHRLSVLQQGGGSLIPRLASRIRWWLQFLAFSEPEQHHRVMSLVDVGAAGFSLLTAAVWALGPLIILAGTLISYSINPSFIVPGLLVSFAVGVLAWLEFLHILYDRPPKKEAPLLMKARYNVSLNIYMCPKCLFPLDGNGGTCKVCGAKIHPAEDETGFLAEAR